jgi:type II restriction/modification system DNA methylase subunit YeeA
MTPQQFIANWQASRLNELSGYQQHFLDLCELLGQPKPAEADPDGAWYTFQKGVRTTTDGQGFADVWMRGKFAWEYKGKRKDLKAAYQQLLKYREDLDNPPLLVVCDFNRFEVHTNFTGTAKRVYEFDLDGLAEPQNLDVLRKLFTDPEALRPGQTAQALTEQASAQFGQLADGMRQRGIPAEAAAHFLMKLIFCLFAEDIELLPDKLFSRVLKASKKAPAKLSKSLAELFAAMSTGGDFWGEEILYFNGGLFSDSTVIDLTAAEIGVLLSVAEQDWSSIEPSIFGTLFERTLDPDKRSQIGAHYTSREDIETLLDPVMLAPLRREWDAVRDQCDALWPQIVEGSRGKTAKPAALKKARQKFDRLLLDFDERLAHVTVLDPACGSGNFLYVALHRLLGLEKEVIGYGARHGVSLLPKVLPTQLAGLEINPYAAELAQVAIWIGYLQWMRDNGFSPPSHPVLEPITSIRRQDAILDLTDPAHPQEPEWPEAEFIVGNPPFLGGSRILDQLGQEYQHNLWSVFANRVPGAADLCCYWFEKSRVQVANKRTRRCGLLATQAIRGGYNRKVLDAIRNSGDIFFAISDQEWVLDGALVHVSMIGFDDGAEASRTLDGQSVSAINANLTSNADVTTAQQLKENNGISFIGSKKAGEFNIPFDTACHWLRLPNPHCKPNSDVLFPWVNGSSLVNTRADQWIIDTGATMTVEEFARYEEPFKWTLERVKPDRDENKETRTRENWWRFKRFAPEMRIELAKLPRYMAIVRHAKHHIIAWLDNSVICDDGIFLFARCDEHFFGVLHSRVHEVWARSQGTQVRERESGFRYTPTTCFETFPFPEPTDDQRAAVAAAAKELDRLRTNWLNPPELVRTEVLEFPGTVGGPWSRYIDPGTVVGEEEEEDRETASVRRSTIGASTSKVERRSLAVSRPARIGTVKYPRLVPRDEECAKELKKRTLTNLYNQRPTWLAHAHRDLDAAVFAAYGWSPDLSDDDLLAKLLALNLERAGV